MKPPYIATNLEELFDNSNEDVQKIISGGEVASVTAILGKVYKIPLGSYITLSNIISFILIGALKPDDVLRALQELLGLNEEDSYKLAQDLEKSILEKARISILGKSGKNIINLTFKDTNSPDELRKEILDTTKRESGLIKDQSTSTEKVIKPRRTILTPGSRSELLEQLQVLDTIPNDEEVNTRLNHIQEQISSLNKKDERALDSSNVALQNFMNVGETKGPVIAETKSATYSKAPTKYNIDPYREVSEV